EINYRRFFDINTLAGLRVEDETTFRALHVRIVPLIESGAIDGLRLDHIDGLSDPAGYCRRLQEITTQRPEAQAPFYVIVEKILGEGERLPHLDGVAGTTGYEWLNVISQTLLDVAGLPLLDRLWRELEMRPFSEILAAAKRDTLTKLLASEFNTLVRLLE